MESGRGGLSPFCNKISPVVYISRPVASGQLKNSYEQEQKFPDWEKMEGLYSKEQWVKALKERTKQELACEYVEA